MYSCVWLLFLCVAFWNSSMTGVLVHCSFLLLNIIPLWGSSTFCHLSIDGYLSYFQAWLFIPILPLPFFPSPSLPHPQSLSLILSSFFHLAFYFQIIIDSHAALTKYTERSLVSFTQFPHDILQNHSRVSQPGY